MANTYIETIGSKADSIHHAVKQDVVLAFDYTNDDFYGEVQGFWIHGWTGKDAVMGKFKFLTCVLFSYDIPQKIL